jgi:hypothetical protein
MGLQGVGGLGWKEISRVKRERFTLLPAPGKALKRLVKGGTCYEKTCCVKQIAMRQNDLDSV